MVRLSNAMFVVLAVASLIAFAYGGVSRLVSM